MKWYFALLVTLLLFLAGILCPWQHAMYIIVLLSAIWIAVDSAEIKLQEYKTGISYHPVALFFCVCFLWLAAFPWYLIVRGRIRGGVQEKKSGYIDGNTGPEAEAASLTDKGEDGVKGLDLLIGVPAIWGGQILLGVAIMLLTGSDQTSIYERPGILMLLTFCSGAVILLVTWAFMCRKYGKSVSEGFLMKRIARKVFAGSVLLGGVFGVVAAALCGAFTTGEHTFTQLIEQPNGFPALAAMMLLLPFVEEIYYRGFIYSALERRFNALAATVIVVIWFPLAHVPQSINDPIAILAVAMAGLIWTIQRRVTGSITASMITHWTYNFTLVLLTLPSL